MHSAYSPSTRTFVIALTRADVERFIADSQHTQVLESPRGGLKVYLVVAEDQAKLDERLRELGVPSPKPFDA